MYSKHIVLSDVQLVCQKEMLWPVHSSVVLYCSLSPFCISQAYGHWGEMTAFLLCLFSGLLCVNLGHSIRGPNHPVPPRPLVWSIEVT